MVCTNKYIKLKQQIKNGAQKSEWICILHMQTFGAVEITG